MFQLMLKQLREREKISQADLAARLGVSQSTVGMWESGRNKPGYATLLKLASLFHVSVDELVGTDTVLHSMSAAYNGSTQTTLQLHMPDASMEPAIRKGDLLMVQSQAVVAGGDIIVCEKEGRRYVRYAYPFQNGYLLQALQGTEPPMYYEPGEGDISLTGVVSELHRRFR